MKQENLEELSANYLDKVYAECGHQDEFGKPHVPYYKVRDAYEDGYKDALADIKQRVKEIIGYQERARGRDCVDIGLRVILGHIILKQKVEIKNESAKQINIE